MSLLQTWDSYLVPGSTSKNIWTNSAFTPIMLNTDMALAFDAGTDNGLGIAPVSPLPNPLPAKGTNPTTNQKCGPPIRATLHCSGNSHGTKLNVTAGLANVYATNNTLFLQQFAISFTRMVNVGYKTTATGVGKLGLLNLLTCA